jgi:hypothetical protein
VAPEPGKRTVDTADVTDASDAFDPATYDEVVAEIPDDEQLQAQVAAATAGLRAERFPLGDIVVPADPADVVTPIDGVADVPSPAADQLSWLEEAGLTASLAWAQRDLAVLVGDKPG